MNKGYFKDKAGVLSTIRGAYADTGDGTARRVLKAYVGGRDNRARLWFEHLRRVRSIAVTVPPAKGIYTAGEVFDPAGMVITATYRDGGTAAVTGYTCSPAGPLSLSDTEITIRYELNGTDASVTLPVRVTDEPFYVTGITIVTPPTKTAYFYGETFLSAGIAVTASYTDGSTADVTAECTFTPLRALELGDTAITATYRENGFTVTAVQSITVVRRLLYIAITAPPAKTEYEEGEIFIPSGMAVQAYYNDSTSAIVTGYTWSPGGLLASENDTVTVLYTENGVTQTAVQAITVLSAISPVFGENSWDVIGEQARLIAAGGPIPKGWKLGDIKVSTATEVAPYLFQIVGFNVDTNSDTGEKAGISLMTKDLSSTETSIHSTTLSRPGFSASRLYSTITTTIYNSLPEDLKRWMVPTTRYQCLGNTGNATTYTSHIWIPFNMEMQSANSWPDIPFVQYPLFTNSSDINMERKKYGHGMSSGTAYPYWTSNITSTNAFTVTAEGTFTTHAYKSPSLRYPIGVCLG